MRLHFVGLPWANTTRSWSTCAYTQKVVKAGKMFTDAGHEVVVYAAGEANDTVCSEHVPVISEAERVGWFGARDVNDQTHGGLSWDRSHPAWVALNERAAAAILDRAGPRDLVLLIGGNCMLPLSEAVHPLQSCEPGVGYEGVFTHKCAFESHVWRHHVYGLSGIRNGRWFDTVIPNYFDPDDFPADVVRPSGDRDYLLFIGRVTQRKGPHVAAQIAERLGMRLLVAGPGVEEVGLLPGGGHRIYGDGVEVSGAGVEYVGVVGPDERAELMAGAVACLVPTLYLEPFGGVGPEAMLSGTPVVAPDFGAFVETVEPGRTGELFSSLQEGCDAVVRASGLDPSRIRERALERFALAAVAPLFDRWFARLDDLWGDGWYAHPPGVTPA